MNRVVDIDHLSIRVSNIRTSKAFYSKLFSFLGFKVLADYGNQIGWTNGKTRFWIGAASSQGKNISTVSVMLASIIMRLNYATEKM